MRPSLIEFLKVTGEIIKHFGAAVVKLATRIEAEDKEAQALANASGLKRIAASQES